MNQYIYIHIYIPCIFTYISGPLGGGEISRDLVADVSIAAVFDSKASNKAHPRSQSNVGTWTTHGTCMEHGWKWMDIYAYIYI